MEIYVFFFNKVYSSSTYILKVDLMDWLCLVHNREKEAIEDWVQGRTPWMTCTCLYLLNIILIVEKG